MLARNAESLYWIGRYVERADDTARILDVTVKESRNRNRHFLHLSHEERPVGPAGRPAVTQHARTVQGDQVAGDKHVTVHNTGNVRL